MLEHVTIPRVTWDHRGSAGWFLEDGEVQLVCGGCGKHAGHLRNHTVEADGTVHASILCEVKVRGVTCGWHVMGKLDGWDRGRKAPGEQVRDAP